MLWLVLLLQAFAPAEGPHDGPLAQWEMTVRSSERQQSVRRVCQAAPTDEDYLSGVEGMRVQGDCAAPVLRRTGDGWVREQRCVSREGAAFVLRAARRGDLLRDAEFNTTLVSETGGEHWAISTRLRRVGACRGEPDEPAKGPTRCPGRVLRGSC